MKRPDAIPENVKTQQSPIAVRCTVNRAYLKANAGSAVFVAVDVKASAPPAVRNRMNVTLAIDSSGSMDGEKMEQAKAAASGLIKQLKPTDQISIVSFSDTVKVELPTSPVADSRAAEAAIKAISVRGLTAMYAGLEFAFNEARQTSRQPGTVNRVLLLTDGMPTVGKTTQVDFKGLAQAMRDSGITITSIGIGNDYNESLLTQIAQSGAGLWHHIKDGRRDLPQLFQEQVEQMAATILTNPELKVSMMPGAELADAYNVKPMLTRMARPRVNEGAFSIPLRDLISGQEQNVVFRIGVSARPKGKATLLRAALKDIAQEVVVTFTEDPKLWNGETNPYPRVLLSSAEATVLMQSAIQKQEGASLQKAQSIMKTIAADPAAAAATRMNPVLTDVVTTVQEAQATVARTGLHLSEGAKKDLLQETIIIRRKKPRV